MFRRPSVAVAGTSATAQRHSRLAQGTRTRVANHKSALKRIRQTRKRQDRNIAVRSRMRTIVKKFRNAVEAGEADADEKLRAAEGEIRKAASKGIIPARRASRTISRLTKSLNASKSSTASKASTKKASASK